MTAGRNLAAHVSVLAFTVGLSLPLVAHLNLRCCRIQKLTLVRVSVSVVELGVHNCVVVIGRLTGSDTLIDLVLSLSMNFLSA